MKISSESNKKNSPFIDFMKMFVGVLGLGVLMILAAIWFESDKLGGMSAVVTTVGVVGVAVFATISGMRGEWDD